MDDMGGEVFCNSAVEPLKLARLDGFAPAEVITQSPRIKAREAFDIDHVAHWPDRGVNTLHGAFYRKVGIRRLKGRNRIVRGWVGRRAGRRRTWRRGGFENKMIRGVYQRGIDMGSGNG